MRPSRRPPPQPLLLAALAAAAVLAMGLNTGWFVTQRGEDAPGGPVTVREPSSEPRAPTLVGVERTAPAAPVRAPTPAAGRMAPAPAEHSGPTLAERVAALKADIQRTIEPAGWGEGSRWALEAHNGLLVAQAPREVLAEIHAWLEGLRRAREPAPTSHDASAVGDAERKEARLEVERLLLRLARQLDRWERVVDALRGGRSAEQVVLLALIADEEHGHPWLALAAAGAAEDREERRAELVRLVDVLSAESASLDALVLRWPDPTTFATLEQARRRAGLARYARTRAEWEPALSEVRVSLELDSASVRSVLRHLQAATRINIAPDLHVAPGVAAQALDGFRVRDEPLTEVLERLVRGLPEGHVVRPLGSSLVLTRADAEPLVIATIFDVSDLLSDRPAEFWTEPKPEAVPAVPGGAAPPPAPSTVPR